MLECISGKIISIYSTCKCGDIADIAVYGDICYFSDTEASLIKMCTDDFLAEGQHC